MPSVLRFAITAAAGILIGELRENTFFFIFIAHMNSKWIVNIISYELGGLDFRAECTASRGEDQARVHMEGCE